MLHIKSNVSVLGPAIGYRVDESGFSWTGESRLTAADLLAAESAGDERVAGRGGADVSPRATGGGADGGA